MQRFDIYCDIVGTFPRVVVLEGLGCGDLE